MDPDALIEALRGTMDPNLREAAERQLNEVKVKMKAVVARSWLGRASAVHNIKMVRSRRLGSTAFSVAGQAFISPSASRLSDCPDFSCCFLRDKRDVISPFCD